MPNTLAHFTALVLVATLLPAKAAPHLCEPHERVAFNCTVGKKTMSLCAGGSLTKSSGSLQYRFGLVGRPPELVFPLNPARHDEAFSITRSHVMQQGAHYMQFAVEFQNSGVKYQLNWGEAGEAGVSVTSDSRNWSDLQCAKSSVQLEVGELEQVVDFDL